MDDIPGARGGYRHTLIGYYGPPGRRVGPWRALCYGTRFALTQEGGLVIEVVGRGRSARSAERVARGLLTSAAVRLCSDMRPAEPDGHQEPPPGSVAAEITRAREAAPASPDAASDPEAADTTPADRAAP